MSRNLPVPGGPLRAAPHYLLLLGGSPAGDGRVRFGAPLGRVRITSYNVCYTKLLRRGRRAGTENVLLAVALGAACDAARGWIGMEPTRALRDRFWEGLRAIFGQRITLNGHPTERLPNTLNVNFVGRIGAEVLAALPGVAASTGSACHAGSVTLSPVLAAMGVPPGEGIGAVRFSLGRATTWA